MLAPWFDHPILFYLWQMQDDSNTGANSRCASFWWATETDTMGMLLSSLCPLFISYIMSRVDFTKKNNNLLQPLAQSLEDLEMVSQQVYASVSEVTLARDEKAEVLYNIWAFGFCTLCYNLGLRTLHILLFPWVGLKLIAIFTNVLQMLKQPSRNAQLERQVFSDFFCHPKRLENRVEELLSRSRVLPE